MDVLGCNPGGASCLHMECAFRLLYDTYVCGCELLSLYYFGCHCLESIKFELRCYFSIRVNELDRCEFGPATNGHLASVCN
jgi:hypothetical protein